jgi:hypothetical protein
MKNDVIVRGNRITVKPKAEDAGARVHGSARKLAEGKKLSDDERDTLLVAIAQALGVRA